MSIEPYLLLAALLFGIGLVGVLMKRNALIVMMCVELMLNAANLTFLAFARQRNSTRGGVHVDEVRALRESARD